MCALEESLCFLTGTGMWEGRTRFWPEFGVGVAVLMAWAMGTAHVVRSGGLAVWEALLLCGLSGWLAEVFIVPRFFKAPLLVLWIIPLTIVSYLLLILPGLAVVSAGLPKTSINRRPRARGYVAALLFPVACWFAVAVLASRFLS